VDKLLIYSGYDNAGPHVFPVEPGQRNQHIKLATEMHPAIARYIADAKKIPGKSQLLIDAMGAGEWWGSNRNGDYFAEDQLDHHGHDYGYETFMRYAYPFKHHVNKDPARAYGDKVILSVYLPSMHRVQLVVAVHDDKCTDILHRVDNGDFPDVSMGCRVPYDQCSICGNRAKNRSQYCDHLKYQMNKILPDGRRVMAYNLRPKFFDISFVMVGAEKASHVLMKVASDGSTSARSSAELGERYYEKKWFKGADLKSASVDKRGSISKEVPVEVTDVQRVVDAAPIAKNLERPIDVRTLRKLAQFPASDVFSTFSFLGIDPRPEEFQHIVLLGSGHEKEAELFSSRGLVFDEYSGQIPDGADRVLEISPDLANEKIAHILAPYIEDRSCFPDILVNRLDKFASDESQWYPQPKTTILSGVPIAASMAGLYTYLKHKSPQASTNGLARAIDKHPWLLGLLMSAGIGTIAGGAALLGRRPLNPDAQLDSDSGQGYALNKTANKKILIPLALAPLAYMYSGIQRHRARRGARLNSVDRFVALRPDLAAIAAVVGGPVAMSKANKLSKAVKKFVKIGGLYTDFGAWALLSGSKVMPAALIGSAIDATVVKAISNIASKKGKKHGHAGRSAQ